MIIAQVLKVIPSGEYFEIIDMNKPVLTGYVSTVEKLPVFATVNDDLKYQRVYAAFHVELIDKVDNVWKINTR